MHAQISMYRFLFFLHMQTIQFRIVHTAIPNDNKRFALAASFADLRPRCCLSGALARRGCGNRMHRARQTVLCLLGCSAKATAMTKAVAQARAVDADEGTQGVFAEEVGEFHMALDALTFRGCSKIAKISSLSRKHYVPLRMS